MSRWLLYFGQWVVFAVHGLLALTYRVMLFFSSRGSLLIVPVLLVLAVVQFHETLRDAVRNLLLEFRPHHVPAAGALDVLLLVLLALAVLLYRWLAYMLSIKNYLLVPVFLTLGLILFRAPLHAELKSVLLPYPLKEMPESILLDGIMVALVALGYVLYQPLSYMLWVVLGTFPTLNWPLLPVRPLRVKRRTITSVKARVVVKKPPKWHW